MNSYITTYKGKPIYLYKYNEFIKMYKENTLNKDYMYIISDKKNALIDGDGRIIGYTFDNHKKMIPAQGEKKHWKEVFGYKDEVVISERPTTEALKNEGAKKLEEVASATVKAVESLNGIGEEALEKVAKAGEAALAAQVANTEAVVKRTTARRSTTNNRKKRPAGELGK